MVLKSREWIVGWLVKVEATVRMMGFCSNEARFCPVGLGITQVVADRIQIIDVCSEMQLMEGRQDGRWRGRTCHQVYHGGRLR